MGKSIFHSDQHVKVCLHNDFDVRGMIVKTTNKLMQQQKEFRLETAKGEKIVSHLNDIRIRR